MPFAPAILVFVAGLFMPVIRSWADPVAQQALDTTLADLQAEINAATHDQTNAPVGPAAGAADPSMSGTAQAPWLPPNVVKRSAAGQFFFDPASPNYPGAQVYAPSSRAASVSSTAAPLAGGPVSLSRWNVPLLLPTLSSSVTTPLCSGTTFLPVNGGSASVPWSYAAPDWIYVDGNSDNPTAWNANLISTGSNPAAVVGRYAYTIYNEGGVLDLNVAGYPSCLSSGQSAYKGANKLRRPDADRTDPAAGGSNRRLA